MLCSVTLEQANFILCLKVNSTGTKTDIPGMILGFLGGREINIAKCIQHH